MSHSIVQNNGWGVISPDDMAAGTPARAINDNFIALAKILQSDSTSLSMGSPSLCLAAGITDTDPYGNLINVIGFLIGSSPGPYSINYGNYGYIYTLIWDSGSSTWWLQGGSSGTNLATSPGTSSTDPTGTYTVSAGFSGTSANVILQPNLASINSNSVALGYNALAYTGSTASGYRSTASGYRSTASGHRSQVVGYGALSGANVTSGGSGYVINEVITFAGGGTARVLTVNSGAVVSIQMTNASFTVGGPYSQISTTGSGVGCVIQVYTLADFQTVLGGWNPTANAAENWFVLTPPISGVTGGTHHHYNMGYLPRATSVPGDLVSGDLWVDTTSGLNVLKVV